MISIDHSNRTGNGENRPKTALVSGVTGQDGFYLAQHLLDCGYEVFGLVRRVSDGDYVRRRLGPLHSRVHLVNGDLTDPGSLERALHYAAPDEVYNLGAQSHVGLSSDMPRLTLETNTLPVVTFLETIRRTAPQVRFYQAGSSEQFGNQADADGACRLTTPMRPVSPYGIGKLAAFHYVRHFREAFRLYCVTGISFNHESVRRGTNFVTAKVARAAVECKHGLAHELRLGCLDSARDWGWAPDYVRAIHAMLQQPEPRDYLIATGETHSVRELAERAFAGVGLDYRDYVKDDPAELRPQELKYLRGDSSESRALLNWAPTRTFAEIVDELVDHYEAEVRRESHAEATCGRKT